MHRSFASQVAERRRASLAQITTDHFVVDTDLEPAASDALVKQLENLRQVMIEAVFEHGIPSRHPSFACSLYGATNTATTGPRLRASSSTGFFPAYAIASTGGEWGTFQNDIRVHELAH